MPDEKRLRFRIRRGDYEVELEGDHEYVREKFEELLSEGLPTQGLKASQETPLTTFMGSAAASAGLEGVLENTAEGNIFFTIPVESVTAKEALAVILYSKRPNQLSDQDLSNFLSSGWKTMKPEAVRARASELRREGRLIAEKGRYSLSGAGIQWIENDVIPRLKQAQKV